jgi:hypothetical protein
MLFTEFSHFSSAALHQAHVPYRRSTRQGEVGWWLSWPWPVEAIFQHPVSFVRGDWLIG